MNNYGVRKADYFIKFSKKIPQFFIIHQQSDFIIHFLSRDPSSHQIPIYPLPPAGAQFIHRYFYVHTFFICDFYNWKQIKKLGGISMETFENNSFEPRQPELQPKKKRKGTGRGSLWLDYFLRKDMQSVH